MYGITNSPLFLRWYPMKKLYQWFQFLRPSWNPNDDHLKWKSCSLVQGKSWLAQPPLTSHSTVLLILFIISQQCMGMAGSLCTTHTRPILDSKRHLEKIFQETSKFLLLNLRKVKFWRVRVQLLVWNFPGGFASATWTGGNMKPTCLSVCTVTNMFINT